MTLPWSPVIWLDVFGSAIIMILALLCCRRAWGLTAKREGDTFRYYLYLLTLTFSFFAISRSVGHLVKQLLLLQGMGSLWQQIAPFSGSINTAAFITVFAFSLYFYRSYRVHLELEAHKNRLEELVVRRTAALAEKNAELAEALAEVKTLSGFLPICASCKKIRDDDGYWNQLEGYIRDHAGVEFSHSICPDCSAKLYPELHREEGKKNQ